MSQSRFDDLMGEAYELDYGPMRSAILEEAIRVADALPDLDLGYEARKQFITSTVFSGEHDRALVAFTWCLAQSDADPERFPESMILWEYKWILGCITDFPQVSRQQIVRMLDDLETRLDRMGYSQKTAWHLRWDVLRLMGRMEEARPIVQKWKVAPQGWPADCEACERNSYVKWLAANGKNSQAIEHAAPILKGRMACSHVPHITLAHLLRPMVKLGRDEQAQESHRKGYRLVSKDPALLDCIPHHLNYLTRLDEFARALKIFEKHLPWAIETRLLGERFHFYCAAQALFEKLASQTKRRRKLRLPSKLPCFREDNSYLPAELAEWFRAEALDLARRFDERNGTTFFTDQIQQDREFVGLPTD